MSPSRIDLTHAWTPTPTVGAEWQSRSDEERIAGVRWNLRCWPFKCISATRDGVVTLRMTTSFSASAVQRGAWLLDAERCLKVDEDMGITVYLEPVADRNALRKLRGVAINV